MSEIQQRVGLSGTTFYDLKPRLAESFIEAGKDVAVVAFGADFVFHALDQNVSLEQVIDASNDHGDTRRRSISSSSQSKRTSTGIKVNVTHKMIHSRAAIRHGDMATGRSLSCSRWYRATSHRTRRTRFRSMWSDRLDRRSDCRSWDAKHLSWSAAHPYATYDGS
jgi:hypothetical protein